MYTYTQLINTLWSKLLCTHNFVFCHTVLDSPPAEPPILELSATNGIEDVPVVLRVSASSPDEMTSLNDLIVQMVEYPEGSTFSKGTYYGHTWTFTSSEFGDVELYLPQHSSGDIAVTAIALGSGISRQGTTTLTVAPVADAPSLSAQATCYDLPTKRFNLSVNASLIDSDGSESLTVILELPTDIYLSVGQEIEMGHYILSPQDLYDIEIEVPNGIELVVVSITAVSMEGMSGDSANTTIILTVLVCEDTPETTDGM